MKRVLIVGATSSIAQETARCLAKDGADFFLVGRDEVKLGSLADDLLVHGGNRVHTFQLDVNVFDRHQEMLNAALETFGAIDLALIAHGTLPDQQVCEQSVEQTLQEVSTNYLSVIALLTLLAQYFAPQRQGCMAVVSSVAGDRGRKSNYVYGSAKGGLSIFLEGLRSRLHPAGVQVLTIKPGFVDTPMTAHLPKNLLYATPQQVGKGIYEAIQKGRDVAYIPWFWRYIMVIIKIIPEALFKKLNL